MREASSLVLAARLQGEGAAVRAYDPVAERRARELLPESRSAIRRGRPDGADAAILVTEWPEFAELDWEEWRTDGESTDHGRAQLPRPCAPAWAGFTYEGIGRPAKGGCGRADAGAGPGRRGGDAAAAADADPPKPACRSSTGRSSATWSTGSRATGSTRWSWPAAFAPGSAGGARRRDPRRARSATSKRPAARHRGPRAGSPTRSSRGSLPGAQRRRPHRPRPDGVRATRGAGATATLALYPVDDPTAYGLVRRGRTGEMAGFLEKPDRSRSTPTRSAPAPTCSSARCWI